MRSSRVMSNLAAYYFSSGVTGLLSNLIKLGRYFITISL